MRSQTGPFGLHLAVGFGAAVVAFSSPSLEGVRPLFLFLVGVPWLAGFLAFYGLPRSVFAWALPIAPLIIGLTLWLLMFWLSMVE